MVILSTKQSQGNRSVVFACLAAFEFGVQQTVHWQAEVFAFAAKGHDQNVDKAIRGCAPAARANPDRAVADARHAWTRVAGRRGIT